MATETLKVVITADNREAVGSLAQLSSSLREAQQKLSSYKKVAEELKGVKLAEHYTLTKRELTSLNEAISHNALGIKVQTDLIKNLKNEMAGADLAKPFRDSFSVVRQLAYILPGMGIAGIFNLAFEGISKATESLGLFGKKVAEVDKQTQKFEENAAKELVSFRELTAAAANGNIPLEQRKVAIEKLRESYGPFLKNLSDEQILAGSLGDSYTRITDALKSKIALQALEEKVIPILKDQLELQIKQEALAKQIADGEAAATAYKLADKSKLRDADKRYYTEASIYAKKAKSEYEENQKAIEAFSSKVDTLFKTMQPFVKGAAGLDLIPDKVKDKKDKVADFLAHFRGKMAMESNREDNLSPVREKEDKGGILGMPKALDFENGINYWKKWAKAVDEANKEALGSAATYANVAADAFGNLYDAMKNGLSVGEAIGNMFRDIADQIVKAAIKAAVFKVVLDVISGGVSAGAEGVGFMEIFKGMLGVGSKKGGYAEGGISTGPKSGHLELLHGTEAIFPMDKLAAYTNHAVKVGQNMGGGTQNITVTGRLSGNDIWLSQKRTDYFRGLTV